MTAPNQESDDVQKAINLLNQKGFAVYRKAHNCIVTVNMLDIHYAATELKVRIDTKQAQKVIKRLSINLILTKALEINSAVKSIITEVLNEDRKALKAKTTTENRN